MVEKRNITIYDIAREAGVSPATVSRILTGNASVRPEKRDRVNEIIRKYQFRPNAMARALSETRTRFIGMISADVSNSYYHSLFTACTNAAEKHGYSILLFNTMSRTELEDVAVSRMIEQRVDAIIIAGGRIDLDQPDGAFIGMLRSTVGHTPVIVASRSPLPEVPGVAADHEKSMDLALRHLIALGHREIGFVYTGKQFYITREMLDRFYAVMTECGLPIRPEWMIEVPDYDIDSGRAGADRLLALGKKPTAVLGLNDMISVGLLKGLTDRGMRIPEQMSLMSFDDTYITGLPTPGISSVDYDYDLFAGKLINTALSLAEGNEVPRQQLIVPSIKVRASCSAPNCSF